MHAMYSINQLGAKWHGEGGTLYVLVQMGWLGAVTMLLHYTAFQNFVKFVRRYLQCPEYPNGTDQDSRRWNQRQLLMCGQSNESFGQKHALAPKALYNSVNLNGQKSYWAFSTLTGYQGFGSCSCCRISEWHLWQCLEVQQPNSRTVIAAVVANQMLRLQWDGLWGAWSSVWDSRNTEQSLEGHCTRPLFVQLESMPRDIETRGQSPCTTWTTEKCKQVTAVLCKAMVCGYGQQHLLVQVS